MKGLSNRIKFRMKLWKMDSLWRFTGGPANSLFPPSFYYTHTEEEIKKAVDEAARPLEKYTRREAIFESEGNMNRW